MASGSYAVARCHQKRLSSRATPNAGTSVREVCDESFPVSAALLSLENKTVAMLDVDKGPSDTHARLFANEEKSRMTMRSLAKTNKDVRVLHLRGH